MTRDAGTPAETFFLNVDLELRSARALAPLVEAFGDRVLVHRNDLDARGHVAWMQLSAGDPADLDDAIGRFRDLVRGLPPALRQLWDDCHDRAFNLGIQAGVSPNAKEFGLSQVSVERLAELKVRLVTTVYAF